jgi:hypothetical protein
MEKITRQVDNVLCKICGWPGGGRYTYQACPSCHADSKNMSTYADSPKAVLAAVAEALTKHEIAVVRRIDARPGVFHVGGLSGICNSESDKAQGIDRKRSFNLPVISPQSTRPADLPPGSVLFISWNDVQHRLLIGEPEQIRRQLRELVTS